MNSALALLAWVKVWGARDLRPVNSSKTARQGVRRAAICLSKVDEDRSARQ